MRAILALEDGSVFIGSHFGATGTEVGEACFNTVNEARRPNIVDHIKNGDIDFIINTPGSHDARADDIIIRSSAIAAKTSYCTNLASAQACVNAIEALKNKNLQVCTIQEYHAQNL